MEFFENVLLVSALRRKFNGFVKSLEHGVLKNHGDSLWRFRLAAGNQWFCTES
jgi:hypothetical protein